MSTNRHFTLPVLRQFDVSLNISASNGRRNIKNTTIRTVALRESNGSCFILLRCLEAEIIDEMSTNRHFTLPVLCHFDVSPNILASNSCRNIKILPLEPSY